MIITNLKARIAALEKGNLWGPTILTMKDGSERSIFGSGDYLLRLLNLVFEKDVNPQQTAQLNLIRSSVAIAPDDGIASLIRALLNSPMNPPEISNENFPSV
jgi:hypothetical protein